MALSFRTAPATTIKQSTSSQSSTTGGGSDHTGSASTSAGLGLGLGRERDHRTGIPGADSHRSGAAAAGMAGRGNYFGGHSEADREAERRIRGGGVAGPAAGNFLHILFVMHPLVLQPLLINPINGSESIGGSGGPSISTGTGGSPHKDLEALLSQQLRGQLGGDQSKKNTEDLETQQRRVRASISREYARPVESIIKVYEDEKTDLYDVLSIKRTADEITIKRAYRTAALSVHPDKNPHPDAKIAFDALQDAFGTLASPQKRFVYYTMP